MSTRVPSAGSGGIHRQGDLDAAWEILEGRRDTHQSDKRLCAPTGRSRAGRDRYVVIQDK